MNESAKKLFGCASAHIMNGPVRLRLKGDRVNTHIVEVVINASHQLFETLQDPQSSMADIQATLLQKRKAAMKFKQHFGFTWPL